MDATDAVGYQVPAAALRWLAGDGAPADDPIRMPRLPAGGGGPTRSSSTFYRTVAATGAGLEAREHTAQVPAEEREEREERFRKADAAGAVLLADHGARRRHRCAQRRRHAQRAADAGQLRPALGPGRAIGPAGAGLHLLLDRAAPRPVLLPPPGADGLRPGHAAAAGPRQRGPGASARARHLAGRGAPEPGCLADRRPRRRG